MAVQVKDIFSRLYKVIFDILFYTTLTACVLAFLPDHLFSNFPLKPGKFLNDHLFDGLGGVEWNHDLVTKGQQIGNGLLLGPESLADIGDYIYTGLADGRLVRVHKATEKIEEVTRHNTDKECADGVTWKINKCGRYLGLRENGTFLYALEAGTGLYRISLPDHKKEHLSKKLAPSDPLIYNDLVFDPKQENLVYITISTNRWYLDRIAYSILEHDKSGFVIAFDIKTGKWTKISEGHGLANGIEVTADNKYLLVSETNTYSIKKIELEQAREIFKGSQPAANASELELFGLELPGEPDNIRRDPVTGDILVGMFTVRPDTKLFRDFLCHWPFMRKAIGRLAYTVSVGLDYFSTNLYSNHAIEELSRDLYMGHFIYKTIPQRDGSVLKLDGQTGKLKQALGSSTFNSVSEAIIDRNGDLYFGSFRNPFLGRVKKDSH